MNGSDDQLMATLAAPGAPFEVAGIDVGGVPMRGFVRAERPLSDLFASFDLHADKPFIVDADVSLSYADTAAAAARLAAELVARGVKPGDRVAIAMRNGAPWMVGFIAVVSTGAIPALINSRGSAREIAQAVELVAATLVLADERRAAMLGPDVHASIPTIDTQPGGPALRRPDANPGDPAMILFTSGTTGRSKGAILSHRAALTGLLLAQMAGAMIAVRRFGPAVLAGPRPQQASLLAFPLFHVSGCHATFLAALASGGRLVVAPRWEPDDIVQLIEREGVTGVSGSPAMIWDLIRAKERAGLGLESLMSVSTGGQAQPVNLLNAIIESFPRAIVGTGFGSTETAGAIAMHTGDDYLAHPRAAGHVLPLADVRIRDAQGTDLPTGTAGEIIVRGPMVMTGYWNDPEATKRVLNDGWFRTGDVGTLDADGNLTILDRLTDMVICGGENIYCAEVEAALQQQDQIVEAAAFGLPDDRLGEKLFAVVRAKPGAQLDADAVRGGLSGWLADYKIPCAIFVTEETLPRNALGKVEKRALRASYAAKGSPADASA